MTLPMLGVVVVARSKLTVLTRPACSVGIGGAHWHVTVNHRRRERGKGERFDFCWPATVVLRDLSGSEASMASAGLGRDLGLRMAILTHDGP
jgi:hypothetical protein